MLMTTSQASLAGGVKPAGRFRSGAGWDALGWCALVGLACVVALTFTDYGVTWDEPLQNRYGELVLRYYASLGADRSAFEYINLYLYGAAFDLAAALLNLVSPLGVYDTRHLLNAAVGLVGLAGAWRLGREVGGPRVGVMALVLLAFSPDWYGHMFNNPKDIPFAAAMTWGVVALVRIARELPAPAAGSVALLGVATGLALGTRVAGGLLFFYLAVLGCVWLAMHVRAHGWGRAGRDAAKSLMRLIPAVGVAFALMLLLWPWTQEAPLTNPLRALREFSHFPFDFTFRFDGTSVRTTDLPWHYLPLMFLVRLPEPVLLGLLALPLYLWRRDDAARPDWLPAIVVGVALAFPPLYIVAEDSPLYDGIRHVLFLLPLFAVLGALGLDQLWSLAAHWVSTRAAAMVLAAAWMGVQTWQFAVLHPHQYVLYNRVAGGVEGAAGRFELDYWGNSLKETAQALLGSATTVLGPKALHQSLRVAVCGPADAARNYFPSHWQVFDSAARVPADVYLALSRGPCSIPEGAQRVVDTLRYGVRLSSAFVLRSKR